MSVVGIDFGAQSTKIGVARNKGIDIVSISQSRAGKRGEILLTSSIDATKLLELNKQTDEISFAFR